MPYMNDPRENSIDIDAHVVWEADNRVEARYPWQAYIVDLCDMSPEEYMKNPIIEAIEGGGGGGTTTKEPTPPEPSGSSVSFYYAWANRNVDSSSLTLNDFTDREVEVDDDFELEMLLGRPTQEDLDYIMQYYGTDGWDAAIEEVQEKQANTFYFVVPDEFNDDSKMTIKENGFDIPTTTIFRGFEITGTPSGYSAFKIENLQNFDMVMADEPDPYITYNMKFLSE